MRSCSRCGAEDARYHITYAGRSLCTSCYIDFYERKVKNAFIKYGMYKVGRHIGVAVSGGKDSMALLRVLRKVAPYLDLKAIYLNLGIQDYSNEGERVVRKLCEELGVELIVYKLREEAGFVIPHFKSTKMGKRICGACGTVKRYFLNRIALELGLNAVATGHNLDDTVEVLFEFYLRGNVEELVRLRPVSLSNHPKMVHRIKPLIEMTDEEDLYYVDATDTEYVASWCPLVRGSRMVSRKELMRQIESRIPGFRHTFFKSHIKRILPMLDQVISQPVLRECRSCGMPASGETCSFCKIKALVRNSRQELAA